MNNKMRNQGATTPHNRLGVYVRVKPIRDEKSIIDIIDDRTLVFDPRDPESEPTDVYFYHGRQFKSIGSKKNKNSTFSFDKVFNDGSTNHSIYETVTRKMVDDTINGYNCSVFAYGATGSGKTHTMLGKPNNPGVIYHTTKNLFEQLTEISQTDPLPAELKICYFEIYNEKISDLLVFEPNNYIRCGNKRLRTTPERCRARQAIRDARNLPVCEAPGDSQSLVIPDLTYHTPENAEQLLDLLEAGNANRSQHPTDANADSSRSHAIFQIVLTRRTRRLENDQSGSEYELQRSKMSLIDLAGSERASNAYRTGNDRSKSLQREGGNINKSLLALGNCINALADNSRGGHRHVPYRNSKLTRLLQDSLGGKCRTAMIATICQQQSHYDDTQNTLIYASRAKCIKTRAGRNCVDVALQPKNYSLVIENQTRQISVLQSELEDLRRENANLRNSQKSVAITERQNPNSTFIASEKPRPHTSFLEESCFGPKLSLLYEERGTIKMDVLRYESQYRINELKLTFKKLDEARQNLVQYPKMNGNSTFSLSTNGLTGTIPEITTECSQALKNQLAFFEQGRASLLERVDSNEEQIENTITKMSNEFVRRGFGSSDDFDEVIKNYIVEKERQQELDEKKFCEQHAYDLAQQGFNRLMGTEDLLSEAANVIRYTHAVTKGRGLSDQLEARLANCLRKLEGKKSVIWKDDKFEMENSRSNEPLGQFGSIHENFSLNFLTPFRNNNTLHSRRLSKNLVQFSSYTPEQSNTTFDASQ